VAGKISPLWPRSGSVNAGFPRNSRGGDREISSAQVASRERASAYLEGSSPATDVHRVS
jgi:hypothetical protein